MRIVDGYFNKRVEANLGTMRKPRAWSVMPTDQEGQIMVQAENGIGTFDFRTREGVLNIKGGYFMHLHPSLGAKRYEFPEEFVRLCLEVCPPLGSETTRGGVTVVNTVQTIGGDR